MDTSTIQGVWTSENSNKDEAIRYYFTSGNNYRYDERDTDGTWHTLHHGLYAYEDRMLVLQYGDGRWYNMGYVGIDGDRLVQGFKRTAPGEGIEGTWVIDNGGMVYQNMKPCFLNQRITVTFDNGLMNGTSEYITDGTSSSYISTFSGKYSAKENNVIVISEAENTPTIFLSDGPKKVCIIDDVLGLLNDITVGSYFTRVPQDDWRINLKKMDKPVSRFSCYMCGGYVAKLLVAFKRTDELSWNAFRCTNNVALGTTVDICLADIPGMEEGMDVRLEMDVLCGLPNKNDVKAAEYFTYRQAADLAAYYKASGLALTGKLLFVEYRAPEG